MKVDGIPCLNRVGALIRFPKYTHRELHCFWAIIKLYHHVRISLRIKQHIGDTNVRHDDIILL